MIQLAVVVALIFCFVLGVSLGHWIGKFNERDRCVNLCIRSGDARMSSTVCWVQHAIQTGAEKLEPAEKFFGLSAKSEPPNTTH